MKQSKRHLKKKKSWLALFIALMAIAGAGLLTTHYLQTKQATAPSTSLTTTSSSSTIPSSSEKPKDYIVSEEEKAYLKSRFEPLMALNASTIAYVYAPGTMLDEPVVQGTDNSHFLQYTIDGQYSPYLGTVFMDYENSKNFDDSLTWLFGHARGNTVPDHRMFNDVNFYEDQTYFDQHRYVVIETPERKYYYEAAFFIIVPETTGFYRTSFESKEVFAEQLSTVSKDARTKAQNIIINPDDKYIVLSTCREEDETIRSNLYLRQIPDSDLTAFLAEHGESLTYKPTR
ncbi:class B sortase, LPKTxAVK-specific [Streptococcus merionis]|uniref:Sortase n=1 Tax=Streptococcus merionis TaxID=400065 RepID=A0A239SRZ9_9STRE|nr:class B sortase, LPKTxAVK-specific [Streptococcus merionis]SNU88136.1 sortase [Streptococcus merionis]